MAARHVSLMVAAAAAVSLVATPIAQSPNAFGAPTAEAPQPGTLIPAVPGSRAQGWLAQGRSEVLARHGIVATSDPLAAEAGLEILRRGGNAIDAAVATGAVLDVTSQNDTGIGGDLFALVYVAREKKLYALNSAGWAPAGWTPEFFREKLGVERVPTSGVNSASVPGAVSGYAALLERFGTMTFKDTLERAARIADEGWGQAERRHADLQERRERPARRSGLAGGVPRRRSGAGVVSDHPQSRAGGRASPDSAAGARRVLQRRHRAGHRPRRYRRTAAS